MSQLLIRIIILCLLILFPAVCRQDHSQQRNKVCNRHSDYSSKALVHFDSGFFVAGCSLGRVDNQPEHAIRFIFTHLFVAFYAQCAALNGKSALICVKMPFECHSPC